MTKVGQKLEGIASLAHFNPTAEDDFGYQIADYLVLEVLSTVGLHDTGVAEIIRQIQDNYGVTFEGAEIEEAGERLRMKGDISFRAPNQVARTRGERAVFRIGEDALERVSRQKLEFETLEETVMSGWRKELES